MFSDNNTIKPEIVATACPESSKYLNIKKTHFST